MQHKVDNSTEKAQLLISRMNKYGPDCSIKFVKMPHRLDLKFEKSFAMAVKNNKNDVLLLFPPRSIRTAYLSLGHLKDYKQYKQDKEQTDMFTTPLHIACQSSNIEAVRILIEQQDFDVNVLVNEKNFIVELLTNSGYMDFSIMNMIFKKRRPQINSGSKLALNQAILRGNPFMIKTLLELGNPNPFAVDRSGKAPIHIAAAKLDVDTFEALVRNGVDPMMPDADGNTVLHIMALGTIKDKEYDFIKMITVRHNLRLTRNKENRTPLHIIRANSAQGVLLRGQPNFKLKMGDWFQQRISQKPIFIDDEDETDVHKAIKQGDLPLLRSLILQIDKMSGLISPEVMNLLEQRNRNGQTAFMVAVEADCNLIADFLLETYPGLDFFAKDSIAGDTALHIACRH